MKSGLAAQAIALIELAQAGAFPGHVRFLATAGEEFGTPGANRLAAQGQATDLAALLVGLITHLKLEKTSLITMNWIKLVL